MNNVKIAHESPNSIFDQIQKLTDYDYCLCHLYLENKTYRDKFLKAKLELGREVMLDTSVFELGQAIPEEEYISVIKQLKPDWYIIPDVLEECDETIDICENWLHKVAEFEDSTPVVVVQGKSYSEVVRCYKFMDTLPLHYKIAISFDYSFFESSFPMLQLDQARMVGRIDLLNKLLRDGVVNFEREHHLLGVSLPQEGMFYDWTYSFITSIDTSNPVVAGYLGIEYEEHGLFEKNKTKLFNLIDEPYQSFEGDTWNMIEKNTKAFRKFWNE